MPGPYTYDGENSAEDIGIKIYGISEREKLADGIRPTCKSEIQIWESALLVPRVLCRYRGRNEKVIQEYIKRQLEEDQRIDLNCIPENGHG